MLKNALAATRFIDERIAADLPVATQEQVRRAEQLVQGNPRLRSHATPLGLQMLALNIPLSKREKVANRIDRMEKGEDGQLIDASVRLKPTLTRGVHLEVEARPENVKAFFDAASPADEQAWITAVCRATGRLATDVGRIANRVRRFVESKGYRSGGRMPKHIQRMAVDLSAMAQGIALVRGPAESVA